MNLKEQRVKRVREILSEDSERKTGKILSRKPVNIAWIVLSVILMIVSFAMAVGAYMSKKVLDKNADFYNVWWHACLVLFFFFMVNATLLMIARVVDPTGKGESFLAYMLDQNMMLLRITLSIGLYLVMLTLTTSLQNIFSPMPVITAPNSEPIVVPKDPSDTAGSKPESKQQKINKVKLQDYIERKYENIVFALLIVFSTLLAKRIFLQYINHRIHYKYYKDRIRENKMIVEYLQSINNITGTELDEDETDWSNVIFDSMCIGKEVLTLDDFRKFFGTSNGTKIFGLFDIDENNEVTRDEFTKRYNSLFMEKKQLDLALVQNSYNLYKFDCLLSAIIVPAVLFSTFIVLGAQSEFQNFFKSIGALLLSLSFAFSKLASDTFQSLIFVFFIRPFDIGDIIEIGGKTYVVSDLGLLYSTLLSDSRYETFPNELLRNSSIKNLRKSTHVTAKFEYCFKYDDYSKLDKLKEMISSFLLENPTKYHEQFDINHFEILNENKMKFTIQIVLSCPYQETRTIVERKDKFAIFVHECVKKLGFTYVELKPENKPQK
ncbi:Small Conductance Mechanosensitive Ion Channel (MscS) Family [Trachipleistophora hominis]|uniref:Small Conductance Mechanosensitive Ion Channel (MscS) Family n=1 Tax=Trachipleistophora hominis TaxID=72359 RepID=L7JZL6_TRAHO|nr:Small Conductance Mechanosensitive Ion Channel (MscS) Family [Trachipleistophora hominis]